MAESAPPPLNPKAGGRPGKTIDLRKEYGRYNANTQMEGQAPLSWEEWLKENGHELMPDGHVAGGLIGDAMSA